MKQKSQFKLIVLSAMVLIVSILVIPTLMVIPFTDLQRANDNRTPSESAEVKMMKTEQEEEVLNVSVYRSHSKKIHDIPLEEYVKGVVAAEMPAEFELEALKAQALTARTYIVKQILNKDKFALPEGAMVTDTTMHQVYKSDEELKEIWGVDYEWKMKRIIDAVEATRGSILTYNGLPIEASFFSTSNGYTENSEDYWQNEIPYLRSVESPWDKQSPKFLDHKLMTMKQFEQKLGVKLKNDGTVGKILARTSGNRVDVVEINGMKLTGREVREKLGLQSSDFTWKRDGNRIIVSTKGYGHGVGMSQYGANGMAAAGKTFKEIVSHYYQNVSISNTDTYISKLTAAIK